ncbi:MAG TPA: AAA domain-containing protein [Thermoanaerobaculia bacterium]|nr:AAA domain-containing protein [Thermoanaerobaculia bacterium]
MTRPYFQASIEELEVVFASHADDAATLDLLLEELGHRKTLRAGRLRQRVQQRLTSLADSGGTSRAAFVERRDAPSLHDAPSAVPAPPTEPHVRNQYPPITNAPQAVLSAWTALEVLSPPTFTRPEDLTSRKEDVAGITAELPWKRKRSRPGYRLYYQVILGSVKLEPAMTRLIERYGDTRPDPPTSRGKKAILAAVLLDSEGRLIESPAVAVSSFAWGVMAALEGQLTDLGRWPVVESVLIERIDAKLRTFAVRPEGGDERPLTREALLATYAELVRELRLPAEFVEPPTFAIRTYVWFKDPNPAEPLILNSFFLADLARARRLVADDKAPETLRRYLGTLPPPHRVDLLSDDQALGDAVAPARTPLSRWPSKVRHPLVLLQQTAVNLASGLRDGEILGVNGPPGTGKTTLLRDVVAGVVVERATAMVTFADPMKAFVHSGEKLRAGKAWLQLYHLADALRGFELVVASSNNKAVENVSAELPGIDAMAVDAGHLRYFKSLADAAHGRDTWGMVAGVLGNAQNRSRFCKTFWWDDEVALNRYLAAAAGTPQYVEERDAATGHVRRRLPRIVAEERPPTSRLEALRQWREAQERFQAALERSAQWRAWLEHIRKRAVAIPTLVRAVRAAAMAAENVAIDALRTAEQGADTAEHAEANASALLSAHQRGRPRWFARLFRTPKSRAWTNADRLLRAGLDAAMRAAARAASHAKAAAAERKRAVSACAAANKALVAAVSEHDIAVRELGEARARGVTIADDAFFAAEHASLHRATPWYPDEAQRARDEVFIAAMDVHRAFMAAAAKPLRHNLGALMSAFSGRRLSTEKKRALLPELWSSLFLAVPLISTTFAAVERMLGMLPVESLGWLLVDEAGQAVPQAAVGALIRTRRALVIGDPLQIEPVVPLPELLTTAVCRQMGVDPDQYAAPAASVQTLADNASRYTAEFQTRNGSRSVGVPLLVHRRCSEPMFSISNAIAYAGLMVSAKELRPSTIRDVLGPSAWLHVHGAPEEKWCADEGAVVLRLLRQLGTHGVSPDLFIITPFVIVAERLRQIVRESGVLTELGIGVSQHSGWTNDRIGTVHTVQGREAEAVIFVLGAQSPSQTGARNWAGGQPNLLNVAATRAKEVLYVIGNRRLWREAGLFATLDRRLPSSSDY